MKPGDVAIIFTPDDTHFAIASAAITAGLHVLVAKPIVKNLQEHKQLVALAKRHNVLVSGTFYGGFWFGSSSKTVVKNLQEHKQLVALAKRHNVLVSGTFYGGFWFG
jgi:hypothetical protein